MKKGRKVEQKWWKAKNESKMNGEKWVKCGIKYGKRGRRMQRDNQDGKGDMEDIL